MYLYYSLRHGMLATILQILFLQSCNESFHPSFTTTERYISATNQDKIKKASAKKVVKKRGYLQKFSKKKPNLEEVRITNLKAAKRLSSSPRAEEPRPDELMPAKRSITSQSEYSYKCGKKHIKIKIKSPVNDVQDKGDKQRKVQFELNDQKAKRASGFKEVPLKTTSEEIGCIKHSNNPVSNLNLRFIGDLNQNLSPQDLINSLKKDAEDGDREAQFKLGLCYTKGEIISYNQEKAINLFKKAARQGHADAQFQLGLCYDKGKGVVQNKTKAAKLFSMAVKQGHEAAYDHLAIYYANGQVDIGGNLRATSNLKEKQSKIAEMEFKLGVQYDKGLGIPKNKLMATELFKRAAEKGHKNAQFNFNDTPYQDSTTYHDIFADLFESGLHITEDNNKDVNVTQNIKKKRKQAKKNVLTTISNLIYEDN